MKNKPVLRLCEWGSVSTRDVLSDIQREEVARASESWRARHRLSHAPLSFGGPRGERLSARQHVGVVEAGGACIEVYPKLDAGLTDADALPPGNAGAGVLRNLLWLLEVVEDDQPRETDTAGLADTDMPFLEMFALLLARRLRGELMAGGGPVRRYEAQTGDLHAVRGRVVLREQLTRNWNRMDRVACAWDEFTPDNPLNRVLRCACRWLRDRVSGAETRWLLTDCLELLDGVEDVSVASALQAARHVPPFDRVGERIRLPFDLAVRLLSGVGPMLQTGGAETFVFLVDMNDLFERYVHRVLEAAFGVRVRTQSPVWCLFPALQRGKILQRPDFTLTDRDGAVWIGDAKYKHLARGQDGSLEFVASQADGGGEPGGAGRAAGRLLSPDDVRQLTVYAELDRRRRGVALPASLLLLYPFVGQGGGAASRTVAWNGSVFCLAPVRVAPTARLAENLPMLG